MSHHVSASPSNPTGAVEVLRVSNPAAATAPVDGGSVAGRGSSVSTVVSSGSGASGTPGATLPVEAIEQASNTIQGARADLALTAGAERRLDGFDGVGGGGGGGGQNADAGNVNAGNGMGAVAQGTADLNVSDQQGGLAAERVAGEQTLTAAAERQTDPRSTVA